MHGENFAGDEPVGMVGAGGFGGELSAASGVVSDPGLLPATGGLAGSDVLPGAVTTGQVEDAALTFEIDDVPAGWKTFAMIAHELELPGPGAPAALGRLAAEYGLETVIRPLPNNRLVHTLPPATALTLMSLAATRLVQESSRPEAETTD